MTNKEIQAIAKELGVKVKIKKGYVEFVKGEETLNLSFKNGYLLVPTQSGRKIPTKSEGVALRHLKEAFKEEIKVNSLEDIPVILDKLGYKWSLSESYGQTYFVYVNKDFEDTLRVDIRKNLSFVEIVLRAEIKNPDNIDLLPKAQELFSELRKIFAEYL